jgi:predicted ribosome quality control (RQC) complex YloA/Tae2 family protein
MKQLSSADLYFLNQEFKILENQRIDNFYFENETFYIKIYVSGKGNRFLTNNCSKYIYLTEEKDETSHPHSFISYLRKYLKNGFIREIRQLDGERILEIKIEKKEGEEIITYYLILELFANGNIILTDDNFTIKNAAIKRKFKDRKVMVKDQYELPPQKEISITNLNEQKFISMLKESDLSIVKFLAMKLGMGGKFAEEICELSQTDKNKETTKITEKETQQIIKQISDLTKKQINPQIIIKNNKPEDFTPFDFKSIKEQKQQTQSFNEAVKTYYQQFKDNADKKEETFSKELNKLINRLKKQEQQLEEVNKDYEKYNELGNKIYENYATIEELLGSINKAAKEKGWEHVLQTIENTPKLKKLIKKLNYKNNEIILEL